MKKLSVQISVILLLTGLITYSVESVLKNLWIYRISFPEQAALEDFVFEDFVFSGKDWGADRDEYVTLVNIGMLSRGEIATLVETINDHHPRVLVMDVLFTDNHSDTIGTKKLNDAFAKTRRIVLASSLQVSSKGWKGDMLEFDSVELSDQVFLANSAASSGYSNLLTNATRSPVDPKTARSFIPSSIVNGVKHFALGVEACSRYLESAEVGQPDSERLRLTLNRLRVGDGAPQVINYRGNISVRNPLIMSTGSGDYFRAYDFSEIQSGSFDPEDIRGKVVLFGYVGDFLADQSMSDMFFSPINDPLRLKLPDMYGVVVQANIISMILHNDLITEMSDLTSAVISLLILLTNVLLFIKIEKSNSVWKEVWVIIIPATQIILLALSEYLIFSQFNYIIRLPITTALVSVSLATTLYFGPIQHLARRFTP